MERVFGGLVERRLLLDRENTVNPIGYFRKEALT